MKWIKISERLPKEGQYCLIYAKQYEEMKIMAGKFWERKEISYAAFEVIETGCCGNVVLSDVSYWMPIEEIEAPMYYVWIATPTSTTKHWIDKPDVAPKFEYRPPKESDPKPPTVQFKEWTVDLRGREGCEKCEYCCK